MATESTTRRTLLLLATEERIPAAGAHLGREDGHTRRVAVVLCEVTQRVEVVDTEGEPTGTHLSLPARAREDGPPSWRPGRAA